MTQRTVCTTRIPHAWALCAQVTFGAQATNGYTPGTQAKARLLVLYEKQTDGSWLIVEMHSSLMP